MRAVCIVMSRIREVIKFVNKVSLCFLSTVDGNQPKVRVMRILKADSTGFYFQTMITKDLPYQLAHNPNVEVCFFEEIPGSIGGISLRISGKIEFVDNITLRRKTFKDRPIMKYMGTRLHSPEMLFFRISEGEAFFWTLDTDNERKDRIKFSLSAKEKNGDHF